MRGLCRLCGVVGPYTESSGKGALGIVHREASRSNARVVGLEVEGTYYCVACVRGALKAAKEGTRWISPNSNTTSGSTPNSST